MTREEEIITACKGFLAAYPNIDQAGLSIGFLDGAVWSDKNPVNVWHDASEEPQGEYEIIYQDEFNHVWLSTYRKDIEQYKNWWEECVACNYIIRWAYISDLLPKGSTKRIER